MDFQHYITTNTNHIFSLNPAYTRLFDIETFNHILSTLVGVGYTIINATSQSITYQSTDGDLWVLTPDGNSINQSTGEIKNGEV